MEFLPGAFEREWERRRVALLHEHQVGRDRTFEWSWRRRAGAADLAETPGKRRRRSTGWEGLQSKSEKQPERSMHRRFEALARGSQPVVVKLASYGGASRVGAMINYTAREGQLAVENQYGEQISGRGALSDIRTGWDHLLDNRASSRDVALFNVGLAPAAFQNGDSYSVARKILKAGLGDRRFVFAIDGGEEKLSLRGVVVLHAGTGERLTGDRKAAEIVQRRLVRSEFGSCIETCFQFHGYGNGVRFATMRVRDLVARFEGEVQDESGRSIGAQEIASALVQRDWRHEMHSRKGRDVMHLIVSARTGTDVVAFQDAVRGFLGEQFAGHRYVFAVHDPSHDPKKVAEGGQRPHVHAHAIITMRAETGERIVTSPQVFRKWRELMAERAREHGIDMELTDRRDQASPPAYTHNQVRPVSYAGRTKHEGTSEAAQARYDAKRRNIETSTTAERSRTYVAAAKAVWRDLAGVPEDRELNTYAAAQVARFKIARHTIERTSLDVHSPGNAEILKSLAKIEEVAMQRMTRPEFEAYERQVETMLTGLEANSPPSERHDYEEIAAAARDIVQIRREYLELKEQETQAPFNKRPESQSEPARGIKERYEREHGDPERET